MILTETLKQPHGDGALQNWLPIYIIIYILVYYKLKTHDTLIGQQIL